MSVKGILTGASLAALAFSSAHAQDKKEAAAAARAVQSKASEFNLQARPATNRPTTIYAATVGQSRDGASNTIMIGEAGGGRGVKAFVYDADTISRSVAPSKTIDIDAASSFRGGVSVAAGDVSGDGVADIIVGAGAGGGPHVKVFDGATGAELRSFYAYSQTYQGGVSVAAGDVNNDGVADIITAPGAEPVLIGLLLPAVQKVREAAAAGPGAGPHVKVFNGRSGAVLYDARAASTLATPQ